MEQFETTFDATKARLKRILARCGWTIHLQHVPSGCYARAVKRGLDKRHEVYIAKIDRIDGMETGQIVAVLPPVA